jgi:prophage maintenance system killer protein
MVKRQRPSDLEATLAAIQVEKERWLRDLKSGDVYSTRTTIGITEVLEAHFLLMEYFAKIGEGVGGIGPKEPRLLLSALGRQFSEFGGTPKWRDRIDVCATLFYGLIKNHPFFDANKRTAFLTAILHLQKINRTPTVDGVEFEDLAVAVADNKLMHYAFEHEDARDHDVCVSIISRFFKRKSRVIDIRNKQITYNDLVSILSRYDIKLENPKGNHIDVIKYDHDPLRVEPVKRRIAHIGFPGWTKEVSHTDLNKVRQAARLHADHGHDSQVFFYGAESPLSLIEKYREPLQRLAYR